MFVDFNSGNFAQQRTLTSDAARDFRPSHFDNVEEPVGSEFGRELKNVPGNRRSQRMRSEMGTRALDLRRERSRRRGPPLRKIEGESDSGAQVSDQKHLAFATAGQGLAAELKDGALFGRSDQAIRSSVGAYAGAGYLPIPACDDSAAGNRPSPSETREESW